MPLIGTAEVASSAVAGMRGMLPICFDVPRVTAAVVPRRS